MRVKYNDKMYSLKSFNIQKGDFTATNGLKLKEDKIEYFIMTKEDYNKIFGKDKNEFAPKTDLEEEVGEVDE